MAMNNPQIKAAYDLVQSNGGDGQAVFYAAARQKGLTDEQIQNGLNSLCQMFQ